MISIRTLSLLLLLLQVTLKKSTKKKKTYKRDESVLVLTDKDFDKSIKHFKHLLVLFHASWCGHCKNFLPTFTKASLILKKNNRKLNFAKIEMSANKNTQTKFNINKYPTLLFFYEGKAFNYTGLMSEESLVKWTIKMSQPHIQELNTLLDISDFKNTHEVAIIYFGNDKDQLALLQKFADEDGENYYAKCDFQTAYSQYNAKQGMIVLYKNYGAERTELSGRLSEEGIAKFISRFSLNTVLPVEEKSMKYIWTEKHPVLILFRDSSDLKTMEYNKLMRDIAEKLNGRIAIMLSDISLPYEKSLKDITNVKVEDMPCVRIYDTKVSYSTFYIMKGDINERNIMNFISDWEKGKLIVPLKSEPVPIKQTGNVFVLVGDTFNKEVLNTDLNCFVLMYKGSERSNDYTKRLMETYKEVADRMEEYKDIIRIAQIDLDLNEVRDVKINKIPSMMLFIKGKKSSPIDYNKESEDVETIVNFLKVNLNLIEDIDVKLDDGIEGNTEDL